MAYGLTDAELNIILEILKKFSEIEEVILFGSRAMGRQKKGSDIDLALKGTGVESVLSEISFALNSESPLPYYFDVIDYESIHVDGLKDHIDRVGKVLYQKR